MVELLRNYQVVIYYRLIISSRYSNRYLQRSINNQYYRQPSSYFASQHRGRLDQISQRQIVYLAHFGVRGTPHTTHHRWTAVHGLWTRLRFQRRDLVYSDIGQLLPGNVWRFINDSCNVENKQCAGVIIAHFQLQHSVYCGTGAVWAIGWVVYTDQKKPYE